jgi:hypothetical protein
MTTKTAKPRSKKQREVSVAMLAKCDLAFLLRFYRVLEPMTTALWELADYGELHLAIDHQLIAPLDMALEACHKAIEGAKPDEQPMAEARALILYQHAKRSGDDKGKLAALLDAFLAIPSQAKSTTERVGNVEVLTVKQGNRIIWRSYRRAPKRNAAKA